MSNNGDDTLDVPDEFPEDEHLRASYGRLEDVLADYRGSSEPDEIAGSTLKQRIMDIVQQESLRGPSTELVSPRGNRFDVTTSAIRAEVRGVIDGIGGLRARRVGLRCVDESASRFDVEASLTMAPTQSLQRVVPQLRAAISEMLNGTFGIETASIDLRVEDIYDD
ncbi:hypothetical protein [Nesterenkonia muleiensis]|uniref:hypothetical protein n=1 Tax=Nesterenkonia muleiensis TaxID=2282648 RepID=UPI000E736034|nr:hypothetical protein [Nesterenkonia muleiensis]